MNTWLCLIIGGSTGTLARYVLASWILQRLGPGFPYGTLTVNLSGCLLIGFLTAWMDVRWPASTEARLFLLVGFCGAFTTFSTLILEFYQLLRAGDALRAFLYASMSFAAGLGFFCAGAWLGQKI